jgi:hypothetical protein
MRMHTQLVRETSCESLHVRLGIFEITGFGRQCTYLVPSFIPHAAPDGLLGR